MLTPKEIATFILNSFEDIVQINAWGETSFFYNPNNSKPRGIYFCTIKEQDGENDKASALYREQVFRLNFNLEKKKFLELFACIPKRPAKGMIIDGNYNFTRLDTLCPHPIYGWMCWVMILNPSHESFENLKKLLQESYELVRRKHQKQKNSYEV